MSRVVIQVPVTTDFRYAAEKEVQRQGFSSIQDFLRLVLHKLIERKLDVSVGEPRAVQLSPRAIKRYDKMHEDFEIGRNIYHAKDVDDLMRQLNG